MCIPNYFISNTRYSFRVRFILYYHFFVIFLAKLTALIMLIVQFAITINLNSITVHERIYHIVAVCYQNVKFL